MSGNNELDQIQKIHKILGTPPMQLLEKMKRQVNFCNHQRNLKGQELLFWTYILKETVKN